MGNYVVYSVLDQHEAQIHTEAVWGIEIAEHPVL